MSKKIKVIRSEEKRIFLHSYLQEAFLYCDAEAYASIYPNRQPGWAARVITATIILAFINEGFINAVGVLKVPNWNPRAKAATRYKIIAETYFSELDEMTGILKSVTEIREFRNSFGHAWPIIQDKSTSELIIMDDRSDYDNDSLIHPMIKEMSPETYIRHKNDAAIYREKLLDRAGLIPWDLTTRGFVKDTFIGYPED